MICFTNDIGFVDNADALMVSYAGGARTSHIVRTPLREARASDGPYRQPPSAHGGRDLI